MISGSSTNGAAPARSGRYTVAIIGAGFTGTMVAVNLLRSARTPTTIVLIERTGRFSAGVAYGTTLDAHLLNVPAGRMSAYPDDADHFRRWAAERDSYVSGGTFVPRGLYGAYLAMQLDEAEARAATDVKLVRLTGEAVALHRSKHNRREHNHWRVELSDAATVQADAVVLAIGNYEPANPPVSDTTFYDGVQYARDPWLPGALDVDRDSDVLLLGSGLTMLDVAIALVARGHRGTIHAVSRRGLLPQPHRDFAPGPALHEATTIVDSWPTNVAGILRRLRANVRVAAENGIDWREVITAIRHDTQGLWQSLSLAERRRFLRHLRSFWETHRHRSAPATSVRIEAMRSRGQLRVHSARLLAYTSGEQQVSVTVCPRGASGTQTLRVQRVINCTGPNTNLASVTDPLIRQLRTARLVRPDELGLGLDANESGLLIDADGQCCTNLFLVGPLRKGQLWENTAVPELRGEARAMAEQLAALGAQQHAFESLGQVTTPSVAVSQPVVSRSRMNIVIGGHVDHGKSTVIGRLMADTHSLPQGKLEQVRAHCASNARPFEYAFLLDALKEEQAQGITIDSARVFFKTTLRDYILIDAPGHIEFLRNLITGAARAEAALLVVDAAEGLQENSRRHGYMMSMLGIRRLALLVNKMDLVNYDQKKFEAISAEFREFLASIGVVPEAVLPVCARDGVNIAKRSSEMPWYKGPTVLEMLDAFPQAAPVTNRPFRMPVQAVYKFTAGGDDRRIVAGTVESGVAEPGMELVFHPSGKRSRIKTIEAFNRDAPLSASAGEATGFTLTEQVYVARGEIASLSDQAPPRVSTRIRASIFWLGRSPMVVGRDYGLRLGTARTTVQLEALHRVIDASNLQAQEGKNEVERHAVAECTLRVARPLAFDRTEDIETTSRFVIVDGYEISGGGIVRDALPDAHAVVQERVQIRDAKWEPSLIAQERRAERYGQRPALVLVTGADEALRKGTAKSLETLLFDEGRAVYYTGIGNVVYGVDADIGRAAEDRQEHIRRLAEVANLMLDAGLILVATAAALREDEAAMVRDTVTGATCSIVWIGHEITTDLSPDLHLHVDAGANANGDVADAVLMMNTAREVQRVLLGQDMLHHDPS